MNEPTPEQCSANAKVCEDDQQTGYAIWYPQMGGYIAKAVVLLDKSWQERPNGSASGGCFEAFVWHDGEWPFHDGENPRELHHCDPEQFIEFGRKVVELNERGRIPTFAEPPSEPGRYEFRGIIRDGHWEWDTQDEWLAVVIVPRYGGDTDPTAVYQDGAEYKYANRKNLRGEWREKP